MPLFVYIATPSGDQEYVTAPNETQADVIVGAGNYDAAIGFSDVVEDEAQTQDAILHNDTGPISGLEVTNGALATQINIAPGLATVWNFSDPTDVTNSPIVFLGATDLEITNVGVDGATCIGIDDTGAVTQTDLLNVNGAYRRDNAVISTVSHTGGVIVNIFNAQLTVREHYHQFVDLLAGLGVINLGGFSITPSVSGFALSSGRTYFPGIGNVAGSREPNTLNHTAQPVAPFREFLGITNTIVNASTTTMDKSVYDDGTATPATIPGVGDAVIKYLFMFPVDGVQNLALMHGQTVYTTVQEAVDNADADLNNITVPALYADDSLLLARWVIEDNGDLTVPAEAVILPGALFGTRIGAGGGVGGGGGGDMFGAASSVDKVIYTASGTSGKATRSDSDITADSGTLKRITTNADLVLECNGTGQVEIECPAGDARLVIDATSPGSSSGLLFQRDDVTFMSLIANEFTNVVSLIDPTGNRGLIANFQANKASLYGTVIPTADYAFNIESTNGAFRPPALDNATETTVNGTVADGSIWWNGDVEELMVRVDTTPYQLVRQTDVRNPVSAATQELSFKNQDRVYNITMTANTLFSFANAKLGSGILLKLEGNFTPTFPTEWDEQTGSLGYLGTATNYVWVYCSDDTPAAEKFLYRITRTI